MRRKLITAITGIVLFGLLAVQCKNDPEETKAAELSGKVTYNAGEVAAGALVFLSGSPNATEILRTTVADADGMYSFKDLKSGTFYLSSSYNTENTNVLKSTAFVFETSSEVEVSVNGSDLAQDIELVGNASTGTAVIDIANGWSYDNTHSSLSFTFPYDVENAPFEGHFATATLNEFVFDEATPSNSVFDVSLDMSSVETGSYTADGGHGRDGLNGCIAKSLGVKFKADVDLLPEDTTALGSYTASAVLNNSATATFKSTSVTKFGDGYLAKGTLAFNSMSAEVDLYFHYLEGFEKVDGAETTTYSSLAGFFKIAALNDFGVSSGHVGSALVTLKLNLQFKKTI